MNKIITILAGISVIGLLGLSAKDLNKTEFLQTQQAKAEKNGWKYKEDKALELFGKMDTNGDGIASGKERKAYWENWKKNK